MVPRAGLGWGPLHCTGGGWLLPMPVPIPVSKSKYHVTNTNTKSSAGGHCTGLNWTGGGKEATLLLLLLVLVLTLAMVMVLEWEMVPRAALGGHCTVHWTHCWWKRRGHTTGASTLCHCTAAAGASFWRRLFTWNKLCHYHFSLKFSLSTLHWQNGKVFLPSTSSQSLRWQALIWNIKQ